MYLCRQRALPFALECVFYTEASMLKFEAHSIRIFI